LWYGWWLEDQPPESPVWDAIRRLWEEKEEKEGREGRKRRKETNESW
jgi:hypothetical protein